MDGTAALEDGWALTLDDFTCTADDSTLRRRVNFESPHGVTVVAKAYNTQS